MRLIAELVIGNLQWPVGRKRAVSRWVGLGEVLTGIANYEVSSHVSTQQFE